MLLLLLLLLMVMMLMMVMVVMMMVMMMLFLSRCTSQDVVRREGRQLPPGHKVQVEIGPYVHVQ